MSSRFSVCFNSEGSSELEIESDHVNFALPATHSIADIWRLQNRAHRIPKPHPPPTLSSSRDERARTSGSREAALEGPILLALFVFAMELARLREHLRSKRPRRRGRAAKELACHLGKNWQAVLLTILGFPQGQHIHINVFSRPTARGTYQARVCTVRARHVLSSTSIHVHYMYM